MLQLLKNIIYYTATIISPSLNTQLHFLYNTGRFANLKHPVSFAEKISWLKINVYAQDLLVKQCADKLCVREYVKSKGLEHLLNPLYAVYAHPEEILWDNLPQQFVLKWNFGCGYNLLCKNKDELNKADAKKILKKWGKSKFWLEKAEYQYKVPKYILSERYMALPPGEELLDYKVYCFHGIARAILVMDRSNSESIGAIFMSPEWELISDITEKYKAIELPSKPHKLMDMITASEILAEPFPFVRVDFYEYDRQLVFGEMTFTPAAGINPAETMIDGKSMGEYIALKP